MGAAWEGFQDGVVRLMSYLAESHSDEYDRFLAWDDQRRAAASEAAASAYRAGAPTRVGRRWAEAIDAAIYAYQKRVERGESTAAVPDWAAYLVASYRSCFDPAAFDAEIRKLEDEHTAMYRRYADLPTPRAKEKAKAELAALAVAIEIRICLPDWVLSGYDATKEFAARGDGMLRILGSPKTFCDGLTRRDMLWAGGLGLLGLGLSDWLRFSELQAAEGQRNRHFGKAKSCILLHLYGAPSQLETFDMKPDAPLEIRGELKPVPSTLPGCDVCELLPSTARVMDKVTVLRSLTHPFPIHGVAYAVTGVPHIDVPMELNPNDGRHWPFIGSVVDYLTRKPGRGFEVPNNLALPWPFSTRRVGEVPRAGPYAAFLGGAYNPVWTEFNGTATRKVVKTLQEKKEEFAEPYMGITPDSRFELATATEMPADLTLDRLNQRRSLAEQLDLARRAADRGNSAFDGADRYRQMAYGLIASPKVRNALDVSKEPLTLRESYGMTVFGQAALAARRLVEAGSKFVTVFWDEFGLAGSGWDTHWDHYPRMKDELLPGLDKALYGLLTDLDARGMLDETLVLCLSEHGRTPKLQNVRGGGRDHWSRVYSGLMAGGGVARGKVVGRSDKHADSVAERPISPKDVLATTYHLLGIDPQTTLTDRTNRPVPLVSEGEVIPEVLA